MDASKGCNTVKETIIDCIGATRLRDLSTRHFIAINRLRELYEKQLEEKGILLKYEIVAISYRLSIEDDHLKKFIVSG